VPLLTEEAPCSHSSHEAIAHKRGQSIGAMREMVRTDELSIGQHGQQSQLRAGQITTIFDLLMCPRKII
jgi:hypothetical protein